MDIFLNLLPLLIVLVSLIGACGFALYQPLRENRRHGKRRAAYRRINALERELGIRQSDYREYGVHPVDMTALLIKENEKFLQKAERNYGQGDYRYYGQGYYVPFSENGTDY